MQVRFSLPSVRPFRRLSALIIATNVLVVQTGATQTADGYYQQGEQLYNAKKYKEALPLYFKALEQNPSMADALYRIGWIYNDLEDYERAVAPLKRVTVLKPTAAVFFELGYANKMLVHYPEALTAFKEAIRLKPDYAGAHYQIGWIHNELKSYSDAMTSLQLALNYRTDYAEAQNELGLALRHLERNDEAIAAYQEAIRLKPDMARAHIGLADVYFYNTKEYVLAAPHYKRGVELKDDDATAFYNLGWCYNDLKRYTDAVDALKNAVRLRPQYPEANNEMGYSLHQLQRYPEAVLAYQSAIRQKPGYASAYFNLGMTYVALGDKAAAEEQYRMLAQVDTARANRLLKQIR